MAKIRIATDIYDSKVKNETIVILNNMQIIILSIMVIIFGNLNFVIPKIFVTNISIKLPINKNNRKLQILIISLSIKTPFNDK